MSATATHRPETVTRTLETIRTLYDQGQTDAAEGGVSPLTIADERDDVSRNSIAKHCRRLTEAGVLERVHGLGPTGPRPSYLPTEEL